MLSNVSKLTNGITHLITAENVYGKKGAGGMARIGELQEDVARIGQNADSDARAARELGQGWKVRPCIALRKSSVTPILDLQMSGRITHIWITMDDRYFRDIILRCIGTARSSPASSARSGTFSVFRSARR